MLLWGRLFSNLKTKLHSLVVNHITKQYSGHQALADVSFTVNRGSIFGLLGPNGAGKTTLIRIINNIIIPDSGQVMLNNVPISPEMVRKIGYLPEERGLYRKMGVREQLLYLAQLKDLPRQQALKEVNNWLDKMDLLHWADKKVMELSKGMQQKVQFIATVVHNPDLLILDEPFTGFDPINIQLIKQEILNLRNSGKTIILSTHRMDSVEELCNRLVLINKSKKILEGEKQDVQSEMKENLFKVVHETPFSFPDHSPFLVKKQSKQADQAYWESEIHITNHHYPNDLLKALISLTTVHSFIELIPSINDIFIKLVKESAHA